MQHNFTHNQFADMESKNNSKIHKIQCYRVVKNLFNIKLIKEQPNIKHNHSQSKRTSSKNKLKKHLKLKDI